MPEPPAGAYHIPARGFGPDSRPAISSGPAACVAVRWSLEDEVADLMNLYWTAFV